VNVLMAVMPLLFLRGIMHVTELRGWLRKRLLASVLFCKLYGYLKRVMHCHSRRSCCRCLGALGTAFLSFMIIAGFGR
jgi:hypothetical protein